MKTTTSAARRRISAAYRFSAETKDLLRGLAQHLTEKDGVRRVTETEVIERAIHEMAKREKLK